MQRDNRGSALAWVLILLVIAAVVLLFLLPFAAGSIQDSRRKNWQQQAYYTAKSAADIVMEYMVSASGGDETPGAVIITKAKEAAPDSGYTWMVNGMNAEGRGDMGECEVTVRYQEETFYVRAEAVCNGQRAGITAKLTALDKESIYYIAVE